MTTSMRDSAIDQPAQHWARTESRICNQLFGINIMAILDPLQQGTHRSDVSLTDGSGSLDVDNHAVIPIFLLGAEFCLLASTSIRLASTARRWPLTKPSERHRATVFSNRWRSSLLS
jgi:hypothetical protein